MAMKDQLLEVIEKSRETELEFLSKLTEEERNFGGTWEKWSAKDNIAHANYWADFRASRVDAFLQGEELEPVSHYEQTNSEVYERFASTTWGEVEAFAEDAHLKMTTVVQGMDDEALNGPSVESDERKMWEAIVGNAYTHKLSHYSEFYQENSRVDKASRLWNDWSETVSPLDPGQEWQGGVHYNAACSLALAGDTEGALVELQKGLEMRPSLKTWSRRDSDLKRLHDLPEYKELFAPSYWWDALEANPQAEALADQFMRALSMFRLAINTFPEDAWREGETLYQRPAGLALHIVQTIDQYSALKAGDSSDDPLTRINSEDRDSAKLPSQEELLGYLAKVEERLATSL